MNCSRRDVRFLSEIVLGPSKSLASGANAIHGGRLCGFGVPRNRGCRYQGRGCCDRESSAEGRIRPRAFYAKCLIPLGVSAHSTEFLNPLDIPHRGEPEAFAKIFRGGSWSVWRSGSEGVPRGGLNACQPTGLRANRPACSCSEPIPHRSRSSCRPAEAMFFSHDFPDWPEDPTGTRCLNVCL